MEWNRMIDRLPPFDKQFLLSVPWKYGYSLAWRNKKGTVFNYDGMARSELEAYIRDDCLWSIPDKPEGVM